MEPRPEILTGFPNSLGTYSCTRVTFPVSDVLPQKVKNITQPDELQISTSAPLHNTKVGRSSKIDTHIRQPVRARETIREV